jgi:hypothetical protein
MEMSAPDENVLTRIAVDHLDDRFPRIEREVIESVARRHIHDRFEHSRVKNFVGIIAERGAHAELQLMAS